MQQIPDRIEQLKLELNALELLIIQPALTVATLRQVLEQTLEMLRGLPTIQAEFYRMLESNGLEGYLSELVSAQIIARTEPNEVYRRLNQTLGNTVGSVVPLAAEILIGGLAPQNRTEYPWDIEMLLSNFLKTKEWKNHELSLIIGDTLVSFNLGEDIALEQDSYVVRALELTCRNLLRFHQEGVTFGQDPSLLNLYRELKVYGYFEWYELLFRRWFGWR